MHILKISEKQHISAIHDHHQVLLGTLKIVYYINHVTECWWGDLDIKTLSNYSCRAFGVWVNRWLVLCT